MISSKDLWTYEGILVHLRPYRTTNPSPSTSTSVGTSPSCQHSTRLRPSRWPGPTYAMCVLIGRSSRSGNDSTALVSVVEGSSSKVDSSARYAAMSSGSTPSVARRRGNRIVLGLIPLPRSRCTQPSSSGKCSYFLGPTKLVVDIDLDSVFWVVEVLEKPTVGLVALGVLLDGREGDVGDVTVEVVVVEHERGDMTPRGVAVENRLDARLEPLGGGVQVRLIFSNGIEHSESDEEE